MNFLKYLLLLLSLIILQVVNAQNSKEDIVTFTGGLSYSTFSSDEVENEWQEGFFLGIRKDVKLISALYFNFGLLYSQQGAVVNQEQMPELDFESGYLDIPLGLKVKIGPFFATAGVSGNIKIDDNFSSVASGSDIDTFDMAYSVGLGVKVSVISLDLRWNNSFADTGEIMLDEVPIPIQNGYFLVGLGISIHKK